MASCRARRTGEQLTERELHHQCIFLLNAGHETTTNLIGNGLWALLRNPAEMARLRAEPPLVPAAVEEMLRYDGPSNSNNRRLIRRADWIEAATSADHKTVAKLWMGTSLTFLAVTAVLFALTRVQLIVPDSTIIVPEVFNRILTATSVTAIVLFAVPFVIGLIGYIVPLQIGARSVALPRLNQLGYWLYAAGAFMIYASFLYTVPETILSPFPPLSDDVFSPSNGVDAWVGGVGLATLGFICFAINLVATLREHARAGPGLAPRADPHLGGQRRSPTSCSWSARRCSPRSRCSPSIATSTASSSTRARTASRCSSRT